MPVSSGRPKRKSRADVHAEESSGGGGAGGGVGPPEKENGAPATRKKKREDKAEKLPTKKQKKNSAPIQNDDGFFYRTRSKKPTKPSQSTHVVPSPQAQSTESQPIESLPAEPVPAELPPKRKVTKKRTIAPPLPVEKPKKVKATREKEKTFSLVVEEEDREDEVKVVQQEEVVKVQKKKGGKKKEKPPAAATLPSSPPPSRIPKPTGAVGNGEGGSMKVVLPVSDTPIIRRNQQLRQKGGQGNRRSSVGMRGRRASSLMDTGVIAEPHAEIPPEDFYKHIHNELLEPQRMKQLLSWCGRRALTPAGPNDKDFNARTISRIIEEELLSDMLSNAVLSSWFNREDSAPSNVVKKPNPRNAESLLKVGECEASLKRLREEKESWNTFLKPPTTLSLNFSPSPIDTTLYLPAESSFTATLPQSADLLGNAKRLVKQHASEIEFQVDQIVDGIHRLQQYGEAADRLGGRVLEVAEGVLAERERGVRASVGTDGLPLKEVLRSLSRLDR